MRDGHATPDRVPLETLRESAWQYGYALVPIPLEWAVHELRKRGYVGVSEDDIAWLQSKTPLERKSRLARFAARVGAQLRLPIKATRS